MLKMKRGDVLLIVVLVLLGSTWLFLRQVLESRETVDPATLRAEIQVDGKSYRSVPLDVGEETIEIHSKYGNNTLKVFDGGIQMMYADCPKKISMQMGFISRPGETIICVPNRVYVEIVRSGAPGPDDNGVDAYIR
ncbi:NusG domain II-containing protein [Paenibacillus sp. p3-SID1389]|uniref:NusG domain II-containing protein n=1 Tax=Paenibacillus sp. p3-SID1389 TaxID=2916364 RepID=UPI0021A351E8|nr:NusG domain II-containing protein [Paenibacillus sp. p3-SID1389]MCT2193750.1 NusG domain II-containing protein [Paenibacillus sp. p3-SID1389]